MLLKVPQAALIAFTAVTLGACQKDSNRTPSEPARHDEISQSATKREVPRKYDGPFGLKMGLTRDEVKHMVAGLTTSEDEPGWAKSSTVPVPHPDFESYAHQFSEKSGLCKIVAIGKDISSGDAGIEVRSAFDSLDEALTTRYGKGKKYDFTSERYDSPEFWMMHLLQKNRTLAKIWGTEYGSTLTNDLGSIGLEASATDMSTGFLVVRYEFTNLQDCIAEDKAQKNKGL